MNNQQIQYYLRLSPLISSAPPFYYLLRCLFAGKQHAAKDGAHTVRALGGIGCHSGYPDTGENFAGILHSGLFGHFGP
jgi:hypothetical protein